MNPDRKRAVAFLLTVIALNALFAAFVRGRLNEELMSIEARLAGLKRLERALPGGLDPRVGKGISHNRNGKGAAFAEIFTAARDNGLEIQEAEYNRTAGDGGRDAHTLSIPVKGSYGQIKRFIFGLETMGRRIEVYEISLAGSGKALDARLGIHMPEAGGQ